ncbi:uncharacterized protein LOC106460834 [Limulus polyphemus]|uniref:Uncharacterized protein LOC106460834 n=1 Tax=Limulus polyphemus TaxID=6850 RepID=A0ABM1SI88_LIMPO|nr:uncharacterized protein LOC106460834 [Limulus polyphemus]
MRCDQLDRNSQGRTRELALRTAENYFERSCLRGQAAMACQGKAWAFERVLGYEMSPHLYERSIPLVQSRRDCEESCLNQVSFTCRSAFYNEETTECKLCREDRRTRPTDYKPNNNIKISYLENQCITASPCNYVETSNAFPTYTDVVQTSGIITQESCERACTTYSTFNCRSFAFYSSSGQCFLSGDDTASAGQDAAQGRSGINYFERKCETGPPTPSSSYTPFPPTPTFTPPPGQKCQFNEQLAYDKVTGYELVAVAGSSLYQGSPSSPGISYECLQKCRITTDCRAFNLDYQRQHCTGLRYTSADRLYDLRPSFGKSYFEGICLPNISRCLYKPVERDQYMLYTAKSVTGATSTFQCEKECNQEREFTCRSYTFVEQGGFVGGNQCLLSGESRETNQERALQFRSRALYAEKNCQGGSVTVLPTSSTLPPFSTYPTFPPTYPPQEKCVLDQYTYEKTSGYDFQLGRRELIRVRGVIGIVGECQNACQRLGDRCRAFVIQYGEYQRCFWLDNAAVDNSDALTSTPGMTYFEKICLRGRPCSKLWAFERVPGFELQEPPEREIPDVATRKDCEDYCLNERQFLCRSATYFYGNRICRMSSETRRTRPKSFQRATGVADYLENQCTPEPATCQYQDFLNRFLPKIDRLLRTLSLPECQQRCDEERRFSCRSVNFETVSRDCGLCSDDTTNTDGQSSLQFRRNSVFSEKGTCEQVSVQCTEQDMLLTLNFQSPFNGRVYAKGNPVQCFVVGQGQPTLQFAISLGSRCGTRKEGLKTYANEVVVQQHPIIVMDTDRTIRVVCSFETGERTVTMEAFGPNGEKGVEVTTRRPSISSIVTNTATPPNVAMRILDPSGRDAQVVGLGDELELRIDLMDLATTYAIFARNLYARSSNGESLFLIDSNGCPTDSSIFPALQLNTRNRKSLFGNFKAFRFPSTGRVNFEVQIRFCQEQCEPVRCANNVQSYGRRKRDTKELVVGSNHFSTKHSQISNEPSEGNGQMSQSDTGLNIYPVMVPHSAVIEATELKLKPRDYLNESEISTMSSISTVQTTSSTTVKPLFEISKNQTSNASRIDYPPRDSPFDRVYGQRYEQDNLSKENGSLVDYPLDVENSSYQQDIILKKDDNRSNYPQSESPYKNTNEKHEQVPKDFDNQPGNARAGSSNDGSYSIPYGTGSSVTSQQHNKSVNQQSSWPDHDIYSEFQGSGTWNESPFGKTASYLQNNPYSNKNGVQKHWEDDDREEDYHSQQGMISEFQNGTPAKEIVAITQRPVPQEIPLSLAITVGEDPEPQEPWSHTRYSAPFGLEEESDMVCTSQSTIIATAITLSLLHLSLFVGGYYYYRWHRKNKRKKQMDDQLPFPVPNNTNPSQIIYGSADVTFRSVYGGYDSPP